MTNNSNERAASEQTEHVEPFWRVQWDLMELKKCKTVDQGNRYETGFIEERKAWLGPNTRSNAAHRSRLRTSTYCGTEADKAAQVKCERM